MGPTVPPKTISNQQLQKQQELSKLATLAAAATAAATPSSSSSTIKVANDALHSSAIDIFSERRRLVQAVATAVIRRQSQQQAVAQRGGAIRPGNSGSPKTTRRGRPLCHPPRLPTASEAMSRVPATTVAKTALAAARSAASTRGRTAIAATVGPSYRF